MSFLGKIQERESARGDVASGDGMVDVAKASSDSLVSVSAQVVFHWGWRVGDLLR